MDPRPQVTGMLTLDVEDWEHANFHQLDGQEGKIRSAVRARQYAMDRNTDLWIELLAKAGARSTCFILGEFAQRYPEAVKRLAAAGHEIASHGPEHELIYQMDQRRFTSFLKQGIDILADLTGQAPIGFRAPSWSVDQRTPWYGQELLRAGIRYDSSTFPIKTPLYGQPDSPLRAHWEQGLLRIPVTVLTAGPARLPFSSGAFFRLASLPLIRFGLKRAQKQGLPVMVVLHPRELDPDHPRLPLKGWESMVHYARLRTTIPKLHALLGEFKWVSIAERYASQLDTPGAALDNLGT